MTALPNQPRTPGDERARQQLFGDDPQCVPSPATLKARLIEIARAVEQTLFRSTEALRSQLNSTEVVAGRDAILAPLTEAAHRVAEARSQLLGRDVDRPFRVVLMGRTMAGKSTLFEFLTGGDGASVGRGGQRTTRESRIGTVLGHDIEIVDTPGVGAMDGDADYEEAFSQVADADLGVRNELVTGSV